MRKVLSRQEVIDAVERRGCKNPRHFCISFGEWVYRKNMGNS